MASPANEEAARNLQESVEIMGRLRGPNGCPWDREQTFDSIKPYTLEETYEVLEAIDRRDWPGLAEELGDFLLLFVVTAPTATYNHSLHIELTLRFEKARALRLQ